VQVEAGGIAQVVGMAESFAGGRPRVCLGDNIFEYAEAAAIRLRRRRRRRGRRS
jgi:dTDP-glucose pyrophosphorylase